MTKAQKALRKLKARQSQERQKMAELAMLDSLTDEQRQELDTIEAGTPDLERQIRAATIACEAEQRESQRDEPDNPPPNTDPQLRERLELRGRCMVGNFVTAAVRGDRLDGAEAELHREVFGQVRGHTVPARAIPIELWEGTELEHRGRTRTYDALVAAGMEKKEAERIAGLVEERAITPAPGTVGVNLDPLQPMVFAPSIHSDLLVDMPNVASGTYASGTINAAATAAAKNKGQAVPATAAGFSVETATPRRIGARMELSLEDIAAVGVENFESVLRQHISMVLSAELDNQIVNGDGNAPNISGLFAELADPAAPAAQVETYDRLLAIAVGGIDGLWATELAHIALLVGAETYRLAWQKFRDVSTANAASLGEMSFGQFAKAELAGFMTNSRMPEKAAHIQQGILCRKGRMGMRTAVLPQWGYVAIDDIYTKSAEGERAYTVSTMVGSQVIVVQPGAYQQVAFRVSV